MTESEAIKEIKRWTNILLSAGSQCTMETAEAQEMAIQALSEVEQYRAIGTIEEFKELKQWKSDIIESFCKYDVNSVDELMKRFRELTEKAEPKKAIGKKYIEAYCPTCKEVISDGEFWLLDEDVHYCNNCGQAVMYVDWE